MATTTTSLLGLDDLYNKFIEEVNDTENYVKMSNEAKMALGEYYYVGFWKIAEDEHTHAEFLYNLLKKKNYAITDDDEKHYHEVMSMFR